MSALKIRRYLLKIVALLGVLILALGMLFGWVQALPAQYGGSIMGTTAHKVRLLQETPGPRLILAGGSSSPYATNCAYIGEALGMNCINVGVTAYFGIDFYLSMLRQHMREGDVIVLGPEHSMLHDNIAYLTLWMGIENHTELWGIVPGRYWPGLIGAYPEYAVDKARRHFSETDDWASLTYHHQFGPLGDVVAQRETMLDGGWLEEDPIALSAATLSDNVAAGLNRFYAEAQAAGVRVYLAFAPVDVLALTTTPDDWEALDAAVRQKIDIPVLGRLADAIMDGAYFYDSNNHLTSEGQALYSERLAEELQAVVAAK